MSKTLKIQCTDFNALNGTHVEDVKDVLKYMYSSRTCILGLFDVEDVGDTLYRFQCIKWYACRRRQRYSVRNII